jgi:NADH dehydrogenase
VRKGGPCLERLSRDVPVTYDYLILATGITQSYFGHDEFAVVCARPENIADAVAIRNKILQAF